MASDTYIKFGEGSDVGPDGQPLPLILGDSDDEKHFWWCELRGCDFELEASERSENDGQDQEEEKPRVEIKPISIKKRIDWASTGLFMKCIEAAEATTKKADDDQEKGRIKEVTVHVCRQSGDKYPYLIVKYTGVVVTKYGIDMSGPEPAESITFKADNSEFIYQQTDPHTGGRKGGAVNSGALPNYTPAPANTASSSTAAAPATTGALGAGASLASVIAAVTAAVGGAGGGGNGPPVLPGAGGDDPESNYPGFQGAAGFGVLPD